MKNNSMISILLTLTLLTEANSWAMQGHSVIAQMAETRLKTENPEVWTRIGQMLSGMSEKLPETPDSLLEAAALPDVLSFEFGGFLAQNHFKNTPIIYAKDSINDVDVPHSANKEDIVSGLNRAVTVIKTSLESKYELHIQRGFLDSLMLRFLIHFVGDIHQPLHSVSFFAKELFGGSIRAGDQGGNLIPVEDVFQKGYTNLHTLFDNAFNAFDYGVRKLKFPFSDRKRKQIHGQGAYLLKMYPEEMFGASVSNLQFSDWLEESVELAQNFAYSQVEMFPVMGPEYLLNGKRICESRMALAGHRLFRLLKMMFETKETRSENKEKRSFLE